MKNKLRLIIGFLILLLIFSSKVLYSQDKSSEPKLISQPQLEFPNQAVMGRVMDKVWIDILVGKDGKPVKTEIKKRDPEMAYLFDSNARKWAMGCRFSPAKDEYGNPVQSWITIPLSFVLRDYTPPECSKQAEPEYPDEALEMGMEGWVGLAVLVKSNGEVDYNNIIVLHVNRKIRQSLKKLRKMQLIIHNMFLQH